MAKYPGSRYQRFKKLKPYIPPERFDKPPAEPLPLWPETFPPHADSEPQRDLDRRHRFTPPARTLPEQYPPDGPEVEAYPIPKAVPAYKRRYYRT